VYNTLYSKSVTDRSKPSLGISEEYRVKLPIGSDKVVSASSSVIDSILSAMYIQQ